MNEPKTLQEHLTFYRQQHRRQKLYSGLAICWALCAVAVIALLLLGQAPAFAWPVVGLAAAALATLVLIKVWMVDWLTLGDIVKMIEQHHPGLNKLLETASEQLEKNDPDRLDFMQQRVLAEALQASRDQGWEMQSNGRLALTHVYHGAALTVFLLAFWQLSGDSKPTGLGGLGLARGEVTVEPGNVDVERGTSLIISAEFPEFKSEVQLVVQEPGRPKRWMTMAQSLDDPTYSYRLANVQSNALYSVVYDGDESEFYRMMVFEFPDLKNSEAKLDYPDFTGREDKTIKNTRRLTAVEGTGLTFDFDFNKPLKSAVLKARDGEGEDIVLNPLEENSSNYSFAQNFSAPGEFRYELHLEDMDGRVNQFPSKYVFNVLQNLAPALKFKTPTGDTEVTAIEELRLQGEARDDFGLEAVGIGFQLAGEQPHHIALETDGAVTNRLDVAHVIRMEELDVEVGQVVSYFLWADDRDQSGELRRNFSDLFFATVRPFDEIFRQNRSATEGMRDQQQQQGEGGEGGEQQQSISRLLDNQKELISATWNLRRRKADDESLAEDIQTVLDSQGELMNLLEQASSILQDTESGGQAYQANEAMQAAAEDLSEALDAEGEEIARALSDAILNEQTALQHLQKLRENEFQVSRQQARQQQQQQGRGNSNRSQRQLDELNMQDTENNYELESKAERQQQQAQQQGERAEQLQTLNRLKELSRRQSDLNERLQELQIALLDAEEEAERERIERELKRLQEEQRDLIDNLDEVQQRMEQNQDDELADAQQQLDQAREQMEETARNLEQQNLSQAANSGSRASRNLDEVEEDYKEQTANEFAEAMREMRQDARELDATQNELNKAIEEDRQNSFRSLSDEGNLKDALDLAEQQKDQLEELLQEMEQVSREAEDSEKLLSDELEDGIRRARQENMEQSLDQLSLLMRNNLPDETNDIQRELTENISELRDSVEEAAEKIIGNDEDAMRFAADQLDDLRDEVEREMENALNRQRQGEPQGNEPGREPGDEPNPSGQAEGENREGQPGQGQARPNGEEPQDDQQRNGGQGQPSEQQEPREGQGRGQAEEQENNPEQQGGQGQQPREGQPQEGQPNGQPRPGQGQGQPNEQPNDQQNPQTAQGQEGQRPNPNGRNNRSRGGDDNGGGNTGGSDLFRDLENLDLEGPLTGLDFREWEDRLREVEEVIEIPELRNELSEVRQRARDIRRENKENGKPPKWDLVDMQILKPLTEINKRLEEELTLRQPKRELVPVDHDPVPEEYSELVRRYYERLGGRKEKEDNAE